eukprot:3843056-Prymnesium_polylepis.1
MLMGADHILAHLQLYDACAMAHVLKKATGCRLDTCAQVPSDTLWPLPLHSSHFVRCVVLLRAFVCATARPDRYSADRIHHRRRVATRRQGRAANNCNIS